MMRRFVTPLLGLSVIGVYLLVIIGATARLAEAASSCGDWPLCAASLTASNTDLLLVLTHRSIAAIVGVIILLTAVLGWRDMITRVRAALAVALLLYPIQIAVGALLAVGILSEGLHLGLAMLIFAVLVVGLAWHLEAQTGTPEKTETVLYTRDTPAETVSERPTPVIPSGSIFGRLKITGQAYLELMKPRLMWLLCLVAGAGMVLAGTPTLSTVVATLGGGVLAIGAAGTFNHVYERDVDQQMKRTADRPLATDIIPVRNALAFGGFLTVASFGIFLSVNLLVAALGLAAIIFYSIVYTVILKPNTVQNTVLGGAAGALPALIGYAAVADSIGIAGLVLAGLIFVWTPAHFYNLALAYRDDYARGGFPMMPVVRGATETRKHILYYLGATLLAASALAAISDLGWIYALTTVIVGAVFLFAVIMLHSAQTKSAALRAFHASNAFLGLVLVAIVLDGIPF